MAWRGEACGAGVFHTVLGRHSAARGLSADEQNLHVAGRTGRASETAVGGEQWRPALLEHFGQRNVGRVVGGNVVAQLPRSGQRRLVGVALEREVQEIRQGDRRPRRVGISDGDDASQGAGHLDTDEVRPDARQPLILGWIS